MQKELKSKLLFLIQMVKEIVDEILNNISPGKEAHGMIFVKDVSEAYEIGTKTSGEAVLSQR